MQEIAKSLLLVSAISALAALLLPEKNPKLRRAGELAIALFVLCALTSPLATLRDMKFDLDSLRYPTADLPTGDYTDATWAELERAVGEGIAQDLASRYGVRAEEIRAEPVLTLEDGELSVRSLTLSFFRTACALDLVAVREYAQKTYTENCEVHAYG